MGTSREHDQNKKIHDRGKNREQKQNIGRGGGKEEDACHTHIVTHLFKIIVPKMGGIVQRSLRWGRPGLL